MNKRVLAMLLGLTSAQEKCGTTEYRLPDGSCYGCQYNTIPDANQVMCVPKGSCHLVTNQINWSDGMCYECEACYTPNATKNGCEKVFLFDQCMNDLASQAAGQPYVPSHHT